MSTGQQSSPGAYHSGRQTWLSAPASPDSGPLTRAWAYARHELLTVCWALMDVSLFAPLALILMPWARFWSLPAFLAWLLFVMLIPFNLGRFMTLAGTEMPRQRKVNLLAFLLISFVGLRALLYDAQSPIDLHWIGVFVDRLARFSPSLWQREFILFFLVGLLWLRGSALMNRRVSINEVGFRLRLGGLLLAPLLVILSMIPFVDGELLFVMLFFLAALMAVALSRAEQITRQETGASYPMSPRWVATVFLTGLFIVCAAALFGLTMSGQGLERLLQWLTPVWDALLVGSMVAVATAAYLLFFLLTPLQWLLRHLINLLSELGVQNLPRPEELVLPFAEPDVNQLFSNLRDGQSNYLLWANRAGLILFVLLILLVVYLAVRRFAFQREVNFEREVVGKPPEAATTARHGLARRVAEQLRRLQRWRAAATIRQCYRAMCLDAAQLGHPRGASQTPFEYLATLVDFWPTVEDEIRLITGAYVRVRYGEIPEKDAEVERIRAAWQRIQEVARDESYSPPE